MRLQTMYLPTGPGGEHPRFALIVDQLDEMPDDETREMFGEAFAAFGRKIGAAGTLVVEGNVEVYEPPVDGRTLTVDPLIQAGEAVRDVLRAAVAAWRQP